MYIDHPWRKRKRQWIQQWVNLGNETIRETATHSPVGLLAKLTSASSCQDQVTPPINAAAACCSLRQYSTIDTTHKTTSHRLCKVKMKLQILHHVEKGFEEFPCDERKSSERGAAGFSGTGTGGGDMKKHLSSFLCPFFPATISIKQKKKKEKKNAYP